MTERLPLFPLGTVLYPGLLLPLHIFEQRYRQLVADLTADLPPDTDLDSDDDQGARAAFGVVAIREGRETGSDGARALHAIGCTAELRRVESLPDGRFDLMTTGARRFRLHDVDTSGTYLVGQVTYLDEDLGDAAAVLARSVTKHYLAYRDQLLSLQGQAPRIRGDLPTDPLVLSYLVAAAMVLDRPDKQRLLESGDASTRLRTELGLLRRERAMLTHLPSLPGADLARDTGCLN
ncbi:MAG: LON peptidase substrate-binding domain-containing protein [Sporichthyaceae bacterium]